MNHKNINKYFQRHKLMHYTCFVHTPHTLPFWCIAFSLRSCSSIVSQRVSPLVSGKYNTNNPLTITTTPNTPYDKTPLLFLPAEISTGLMVAPNTEACLIIDVAEFLTLVGNNSNVYIISTEKAVFPQKKDNSSNPICRAFHLKLTTTHIMLPIPLINENNRSEVLLLQLPMMKKVSA